MAQQLQMRDCSGFAAELMWSDQKRLQKRSSFHTYDHLKLILIYSRSLCLWYVKYGKQYHLAHVDWHSVRAISKLYLNFLVYSFAAVTPSRSRKHLCRQQQQQVSSRVVNVCDREEGNWIERSRQLIIIITCLSGLLLRLAWWSGCSDGRRFTCSLSNYVDPNQQHVSICTVHIWQPTHSGDE